MDHGPQPDTEPQRCRAVTRRREQCPRAAIPGKPLCLFHGRGAGAPRGNQNARKHGFYAQESYRKRDEWRATAHPVRSIDEVIACLRISIADAVSREDDLAIVARGVDILIRAVRAQRTL